MPAASMWPCLKKDANSRRTSNESSKSMMRLSLIHTSREWHSFTIIELFSEFKEEASSERRWTFRSRLLVSNFETLQESMLLDMRSTSLESSRMIWEVRSESLLIFSSSIDLNLFLNSLSKQEKITQRRSTNLPTSLMLRPIISIKRSSSFRSKDRSFGIWSPQESDTWE